MKKIHTKYVCQSCGYESLRWLGKCPECQNWNCFVEEVVDSKRGRTQQGAESKKTPVPLKDVSETDEERMKTGMVELDRVFGGGVVAGSIVLVGGAPGMGKSTLLLQAGDRLASQGKRVLYISGEESLQQIKMRAQRLGIDSERIYLLSETNLESIIDVIRKTTPDLAIIDSIQTVYSNELESLAGNVSQVRYCSGTLTSLAKELNIPIIVVGHVTKEGTIAGPRVVEHLVDGLFLIEGDHQHIYRLVRSVKNRFGSTNEVGIFEMTELGMIEVSNPSEILISQKRENASGSVIMVSMEGTRPLLVEIQALVTPTNFGVPQRVAKGIDLYRLSILLAVLEKRVGYKFGKFDVFVNVAGGLRIVEPGIDLALSVALISCQRDLPVEDGMCVVGEIGLAGEVRGVSHINARISEAERLGMGRIVLPDINIKRPIRSKDIEIKCVRTIREAVDLIFGRK